MEIRTEELKIRANLREDENEKRQEKILRGMANTERRIQAFKTY